MSDTKELTTYQDQNLSPFGGNIVSYNAYKRTEKIVTAAHLVTNFVPENEPVRERIRTKSLLILDDVLNLREGLRVAGPERVNDVIAGLLELATLFDIANAAGYLSQMNVSVLQRACADLAQYLRSQEDSNQSEGLRLERQYFVPTGPSPPEGAHPKKAVRSGASPIGQKHVKDTYVPRRMRKAPERNARHNAVLQFVQEKKRVSIRDVVQAVPGYSEKTIQRELLALIDAGIVRKEGERRWSRYVLIE